MNPDTKVYQTNIGPITLPAERVPSCPLTKKQEEASELLSGGQMHTCLVGGARSGKTFLIVRAIIVRAMKAPGSRHLIARYRFNHVKTSVGGDTIPKVMHLAFPGMSLGVAVTGR